MAPEFTTPQPTNWSNVDTSDAPAFTAPKPERRAPLFGGGRKVADSKEKPQTRQRRAPVKKTEPPSKPGEFTEDLMQMYGMVALGIGMKDPECAKVVMKQGEACAEAWDKLAQDNASVRKMLRILTQTTGIGAVVAAHAPIAMAVMAHHGPGFGFGKEPVADGIDEENADG